MGRRIQKKLKEELKEEIDDDTTPSVSIDGKKYKVDVDTWTLDLNYTEDKFKYKIFRPERILESLKNVQQLRVLLMRGHGISYIGDWPIMENLERLDLSCNDIRGIERLADFTKLKELDLRDNYIRDIGPLEHLVNLEHLWIDENTKQNEGYWLGVLLKLPSLKMLGIRKDGKDTIYEGVDTIKNMLSQRKVSCFQNIKKPVIERKGSIRKEHSVTWTQVSFGSYPSWSRKEFAEEIKNGEKKEKEDYVIDRNGDYLCCHHSYSGEFYYTGAKYRKVNSEYFFNSDIAWRVLDIQDGIALLMADKILDVKPFFTTEEKNGLVSWEDCELRRWLNDENGNSFYDSAFSENEKSAIVKHEDKVRLLQMDDIKNHPEYGILELYKNGKLYIDAKKYSRGYSNYTEQKGLKRTWIYSFNNSRDVCAWWLGDLLKDKKAIYINEEEQLVKKGIDTDTMGIGIRPVIEVDLYKVNKSLQVEYTTATISATMSIVM